MVDHKNRSIAPRGGDATAVGDGSHARGGDAGDSTSGPGGRGGDASVVGNNSSAAGGRGGRGGVEPGMPGGDAHADSDHMNVYGGQGGEAPQYDGRGGRGGRPADPEFGSILGIKARPRHMRWPYDEPVTEPGRGGDGADTPQYKARRIIVEHIKACYFAARGLPRDDVWWDRGVVPLNWINSELAAAGHRWRVALVDDEYEFSDVVRQQSDAASNLVDASRRLMIAMDDDQKSESSSASLTNSSSAPKHS